MALLNSIMLVIALIVGVVIFVMVLALVIDIVKWVLDPEANSGLQE